MPNCLKTYPIFLLLLTFFLGFHGYGQTHISDNLILHYNFNSNFTSGTTAVDDLSSANNDGTLQNFNFTSGLLDFDGVNDFISTTNNYSGSGPSEFTIEIWFKTTSKNLKLIGFENNQTTSATAYDRMLYINDEGKVVFAVYPSDFKTVKTSNSYNDGEWHQALATYSDINNIGKLYIDGNLKTSLSANYAQSYSGYWKIGGGNLSACPSGSGFNYSSEKFFQGNIGKVRVYHDVLSSTEVLQNYNASVGKITIVESGGDAENDTWKKVGNTISTELNAKINASILEGFANSNTINITAESISIEEDINISTSGNGIVFKAKSDIALSSNITTNNGDVHLWSDSDGNSTGRIGIYNGGITSNGGDIKLSGGTDGNSYAVGTNTAITSFANYRGIWFNNSTLNANGTSNGGNITIKGKGYTSEITTDYNIGVDFTVNSIIKTNHNGEILIDGVGGPHSTAGEHAAGINFFSQNQIFSASGTIELNGQAGGGSANNARLDAAINFDGGLSGVTYDAKIYSNSGDITLSGKKSSLSNSYGIMNGIDNIQTYIGTDGTNKTSGDITIISDNFDLQDNYHTIETSGALIIKPQSTSFSSIFNTSLIDIPSSINSLTIGTSSNTANITISDDIEVAGPISLYGGDITLSNSLSSTLSNANVLIKAKGDISLDANQEIHTKGGNIILWSNSDGGTSNGSIMLRYQSKLISGSSSVLGGHIWLGGGNGSETWNEITVGNGSAVGGKLVSPNKGGGEAGGDFNSSGIYLEYATIKSFGGDIFMKGKNGGSGNRGVTVYGSNLINSGDLTDISSGRIDLKAIADSGNGLITGYHDIRAAGTLTMSSAASGTAIDIQASSNTDDAFEVTGIVNLISNGTGNISIDGNTNDSDEFGITVGDYYAGQLNVLSASGNIDIKGHSKGLRITPTPTNTSGSLGSTSSLFLGKKSGTDVLSSTANISIKANEISTSTAANIETSGTLTWTSISESFSSSVNTNVINIPTTLTGLTIGTISNTANITISDDIEVAGPISMFGDDIVISGSISSTNSGSNILLKAKGYIYANINHDFSTNGGDLIFWSNSNNTSSGVENNEVDLRGNNNLTTSGGDIYLAGGLDNGNGRPAGYAYRGYDDTIKPADLGTNVTLDSEGGNIYIRGQGSGVGIGFTGSGVEIESNEGNVSLDGIGNASRGIWIGNNLDLNSNGGDIIMTGTSTSSYGIGFENSGISIDSGTGSITIVGQGNSNIGVYASDAFAINSDSNANTAISIKGSSNSSYGVYFGTGTSNKNILIQSTTTTEGKGDIIIEGSTVSGQIGVGLDFWGSGSLTQVLSGSGDIKIHAKGHESRTLYTSTGLFVGKSANSNSINGISPISSTTSGNISMLSEGGIYAGTGGGGQWTLSSGNSSNPGGDIIIASDTNNSEGGFMYFGSGGLTVNSYGGDITLGGGNTLGTGYATGSQYSSSYSGNGIRVDGDLNLNSSGNSTDTGGDINIRGKGYGSTWGAYNMNGFYKNGNATDINSGTGKINISALAPTTQTNATAVGLFISGGSNHLFTSANTSSDAIKIVGDSSDSNSSASEGIILRDASGRHEFVASGAGGGIIITAKGGDNDTETLQFNDPIYILANGGDIKIAAESENETAKFYGDSSGSLILGYTNASNTTYDLTSSTSQITINNTGSYDFAGLITSKSGNSSSSGGDFILSSNTNNSSSGNIRLHNGLDVETYGGDIFIGGGNIQGTGFALGQNVDNFSEGVRIDKTLKLDSGNGNISIKGKTSSRNVSSSGTGNSGFGIYSLTSNATIDSGTGTITIEGINQNATGNTTYSSGIVFALNNNKLITISSESTDNKAISLTGTAEGSNVGNYGMEVETTSPLKIIATGSGGGISLNTSQNSTSSSAKYDLVVRSTLDILAKDGPIELIGGANGVSEGYLYFSTPAYFGSKSGSDVTESSSDILIQYDDFSWGSNVPRLATSGTVTIKPNSSIFYDDNVETDWFSFNQNSQTMSGLTIGKDSNTSNVTVNSALTTNGPINIFGSDITVQRDLNSSSGNGNISLLAKDELTTASGRNININSGSGNITLLAESPVFDGGSSYTTNINTTGSFKLAPYEVVVDGFDNVSSQIEFQGSLSSGNFEGSGDIDGLTINSIENINGLTIGSASTNYSSNSGYHVLLKETADNRLSIGGPLNIYGNTITIESPISSGRDIKVVSNNVWINDELATNAITSTIELNAANQITQTASISTHILSITGSGTTNLNHSGNSVNKLSAGTATITTGTLSFTNSKALEIGANSQGIKSNGTISVGTLSGNLTLTENISTTNTSDNAIRLLADADTSAPNEGNGNIIISGTPTLTTGSGGRASLFSGKPTSSTGLVNLVGNNNIRIGVDSSTTTFEPSLSSGVYALFRDGPKINLSETSLSIAHTPSTNSLPKSFVLSATGLSQAVSLSAPAGFEISLNEHTGYTSTLNVSQTSGSITDTFVYIRITSIVSGYPTGTLSATSQGAVSESLSLTATAKAALDFDGVNDYVEIPYDNDFNITGDLTMATWFYLPTDYSGGSVILGRFDGTSSTNVAYSIRISGAGNLYSQLGNGTVHANSSLIPIENLKGKWSHVAVSFNATNNKINIYLNGIHKGETIGSGSLKSMSSSSAKLSIGTYKGGSYNGQYFKGKIDELSLWNKVLSHNEIEQQLYKSLSGTENNLVAYYNFNNGVPLSSNSDNDTLYDSVGDNDGDLGNRFDLSNASASNSTWVENPFPESEIPNGYSSMPIALWKAIGTNETRESHGLTLTAPSTLSAENYVNLAANTNTGTTTSDVSSTENIRSNRIWYVNETGSVSARVKIGVASATGQTVSSFVSPTFTLIRRDGTSGNFSRVTSGTRSGDIVTFTEVDLEDGYYSLGVVQNVLITPTASQSKTLGADDPVLEYTTSPNVSLTGTLSRTAGEDIGTYTITLGTISSSLYSITLAAEDFEIVVTDPNINGWDNLSLSYGDTSGVPSYTTSATTTPSFTSSNTSVAAIHASTGTITATGVGTTTLWIYFPAGGQFVSGTKSLTVTVLARTITVTAAAKTKVFGESDPELTFTATPAVGAPVVAGSSATVTFTGTLTRTAGENAGSYSITLGTLSNTNYNIDYVGANFSITKAPTDIDDGDSDPTTETLSDTTITFGDADLLLTPSSSNTADYTFTSSDSSVASITTTSSNTASIRNMGVGSAVISISQAADANYQAKTVSYTLNVNPLSVSVTAAAKSKNYGDTDPSLTYVSSPAVSTPLSNSSTITFTGTLSRTTGENAGTYSITLGTLTNTNYDLTFVGEDFEIGKRPITISAEAKTKVYGAVDPSLTHSISSGSLISGDTVSGVLTRTAGEAAGTYSITQHTLTYGNNYNETYEAAVLTITNATLTLTVSDYTKVYDSQFIDSSNLSFTASGLVNGDSIDDLVGTPTYTVAGTATNTVGTYSITLSGLSHPSYDIVFVGANASITPMSLSPTPTVETFNSVVNTTWVAPANVNQVNYLVVGGGGGGGNGYDNAAGGGGGGGMVLQGQMNVTPGETYNIVVGAGGIGGANIRSNRNGTAGSNSVFSTITALGGGGGLGSRSGGSPGQAQVGTITAPTGGGGNGGGRDGDGGGGAGGASADLSGSSPGIGGVGITSNLSGNSVSYGAGGNGGYNGGPYNGSNGISNTGNGGGGGSSPSSNSASGGNGGSGIVILTYTDIEVEPISDIVYTGNAITPSPTLRFNGNILFEGTDYTTSFTGNTNVGTASITLTGIGNFNGEKTVGFNITSKTLTITANSKTMVYNSGVYTPTDYTVSYDSFVDGEDKNVLTGTLTYTGSALTATNSGTYEITPGGLTSSNYSITFVSGVLSITQKPISIDITDLSKVYGDSDPSLDHTISTGSVYGQTPTGILTRTLGEEVGTYSISKGNLTYGSNYMETFINGELTITARTITVTAAAKTKVFGAEDPELTFTATPAVGAPVVTGSAATVTFTGTLTRTAGENAGTYSITLGTLSNTNYTIDYVGADFTITKAPTDIEDGDSDPATETLSDTTITFGDADLLLTPTSPNTADYTFTSSDSSVASITTTSTNTASIRNMGVGSAVISISQAADANYQAKTVSYTLSVNPLSVSVTAAAKSKNYGDTDPSLTYVSSPAINTPLSNSSTITFTGTLSRTAGENAGTYSITLGTLSNTNYSIDYVGTNLTIAKITPTITLNDLSVVYGDADLNLAHSATDSYTIVSPTDNSGTAKWITNGHYNSPPLTFGGNWYQPWLDAPISWAAKEASGINYYIQLDLGEEQLVSGIITQGKGSGSNHQWIKRAKIEYSSDGVNFTTAFNDTPLNSDGNSKVHTDFSAPTRMRHIRLWSTGINQNHASVRMGAKVLNTYNSGTYTSANTSVGTISDTLFSNIGVGTTVISYTQDSSMNYLSATKTFTLTVNPLAVTVSPTSTISKIYGATDPALTFTYSPTATVNSKTITFTGELLRDFGENVGTYSITLGTLTNTNYNISLVEEDFEITAKTITATLTGSVNKTYNGTVSATLHTSNFELSGFISGESATITQTFGTYDSKNVGTNKEVSVSLSNAYAPASGTLLSNYILAATATGTVGNITAKTLTVTNITALDKVYDGSTDSNINSSTIVYNGLELGDDVSINSTSGVFDNKNVGVNKTISLTNTYGGADLSNYALVDQASATASITAKTVSASLIGSVTKVYNGTLSATLNPSNFQLNGVISGESIGVSATQGTYDTKEIGSSKMVTVSLTDYYLPDSGTLLSNYALADTATGTVGTITAQTLTVTGIVVLDKVFDGTASSTVMTNTIAYEGLAAGDNVYIDTSSGVFADANVGQGKTVNLTNTYAGTDLTNYTVINQATTTASITAKPITIIPTASQSKTYGESNTPLTYTISPSTLPNGTTITLGGTLSRTLGENVGTYSISLGTVSNTNYNITLSPQTFAINKKTVTVSGITAGDKVYDANTNASVDLSGITFTGKETGDTITATVTGTFDTKDIGTAKTVNLSATYSSSALANYTIVDQSSTTASITAKTVSVTGSTGLNKTYDGNTNLPLGEIGYGSLTGVIGSEDVTLSGVGVYDAASVGSRTIVIGTVTLTGADKGNYSLNWTNGSGTISKKTLTVTANNDAKFVGEPDTSGFNGVSYSGFEGSDSVSDINVSGLAITRSNSSQNDAGNYPGTLVPSGVVATNYDFNYVAGDYTIIPADKLLLRVANQTTTYGTAASYSITSAQYYKTGTGLVSLTVPTPVSGVYPINDGASTINIRVQPASPVNSTAGKLAVGSYGLSATVVSGSSGNFSNNIEVIGSHSVAKKSLTATASGVSKEYDATTSMSGVSLGLTGLESSDAVTVNGTGAFSSPSAGTGLSYTIAGLSLAGADADNYYLSAGASFSGANGVITKAPLTVTANNDNGVDTDPAYSGGNGVTYTGFKGLDGVSDLGGTLSYTGTSQGATAAGTYTIVPGGLTSSNYSITFVAGTLTIIVGDSDGDGVRDPSDNCPTTPNADQADADGDGVGDVCDNAPGISNPDQRDTDADGIGDVADPDDDNDGCPDTSDAFPLDPSECSDNDGDGIGDNADTDDDNDGVLDTIDNCAFTPNPTQSDIDLDGIGDVCDTDIDGDGWTNEQEQACGSNRTDATDTLTDFDQDGLPDCSDPDDDNDGVADVNDAFPIDATEWLDTDADGTGNNADIDDDNDGQSDEEEIFCGTNPLDASSFSGDVDADGITDCRDTDNDNDGVNDVSDAFPLDPAEWTDTDADGIGNNADTDDDGDGYSDLDELECNSNPLDPNELPADLDGDGIPDCKDTDLDGDGCINTEDVFPRDPSECLDTDGDGLGDNVDVDDDGDGVIDLGDAFPLDPSETKDSDGDGIGDNADPDDNNDGFDDEKLLVSGLLTPNSSGMESTWKIINIEQYPNARVSVFDKNGMEVFRAQNYRNDWRGTYKNRALPAGSYLYRLNLGDGTPQKEGWLYISY